MALTNNEVQVTWDTGNNTDSVSGSSSVNSDTMTLTQTGVAATITCKADHSGSPGSDDYVDFFQLAGTYDPDGASTAENASNGHGEFIGRCDCNTDDPAIITVPLPVYPCTQTVIRAVNNAGETVTVSATILEQRNA